MAQDNILDIIIRKPEGMFFEVKRIAKKPLDILETIIAFANSEGGVLALGVEDPSKAKGYDRLIGISEKPDNYAELLRLLSSHIQPIITGITKREIIFQNHGIEDKIVLLFVDKSNEIHSLVNGDTFIRTENGNKKIGNQEIIRLKYEKGSLKFEDELLDIDTLESFDKNLWNRYKDSIDAKADDDRQILKDNGLADKRNNKRYLKKAAILLFSNNPSVVLGSKSGIKISHYYGIKENFSGKPNFVRRPFSVEGPLLIQIERVIEYFKDIVKNAPPKLIGAGFASSILIPERVFQEVITNAVIHRNYSIQNDIQIRIFDDRIEVESPGSYPGHITPTNIQQERFARNPVILRTLNRFDNAPNLDIGEGVNRMFQLMKEHNLYEPKYSSVHEKPHSVLVILLNVQKIKYRDTINNYLMKNEFITNHQSREITGISDTLKMTRLLKSWVEKGLLVSIGEKRHTIYKKPNADGVDILFSGSSKIEI